MTATVVPDQASPCFGGRDTRRPPSFVPRWPERPMFIEQITVVDNGDGSVTATATGADYATDNKSVTVTKTIKIKDHTMVRVPTGQKPGPRHGAAMESITPAGGGLRWRVLGDPTGEKVFSDKARAEARAEAINQGKVVV